MNAAKTAATRIGMDAVFVELPPFEHQRDEYMDDTTYSDFQQELMKNPEAGDVIQGTGGLRVIYYWWSGENEFLLFTVYGKDEVSDLTPKQKQVLAVLLKNEKERRGGKDEKKKPIRRTGRRL
jgi:hypothetical protein